MRGDLSWLTATDGGDHLVTESAAVIGRLARRGCYVAMCGHLIEAASLTVGPRRRCRVCVGWV